MFNRFIFYIFFIPSFLLSCDIKKDSKTTTNPTKKSSNSHDFNKPNCEDCIRNQNSLLDSIAFYSDSLKKTNDQQLSLKLFNSIDKLNLIFLSKCANCEDVDEGKLAEKLTKVYDVVHDVKLQKSIENELLEINN